jgi:Tol biopolymer transport system component
VIAFVHDPNGRTSIDVMRANGTAARVLRVMDGAHHVPGPSTLSWSPDGTRLAFSLIGGAETCGQNIYVMNADGSGLKALTNAVGAHPTSNSHPSWSPDGTRIAFVTSPWVRTRFSTAQGEGTRCGPVAPPSISVMRSDGTDVRAVTTWPAGTSLAYPGDLWPTWSPDGSQIAFSHNDGVSMIGADGSGSHQVHACSYHSRCAHDASLAWSPDGSWIAFISPRKIGKDGRTVLIRDRIVEIRPDGKIFRVLFDCAAPCQGVGPGLSWSPDGSHLLFTYQRDSQTRANGFSGTVVARIGSDGTGLRFLTTPAMRACCAAWRP